MRVHRLLARLAGVVVLAAGVLAWSTSGAEQPFGHPSKSRTDPGTSQPPASVPALNASGMASAVQANVLGLTTTLASTGTLASATDARDASQLDGSVPTLLSGETLHATAIGLSDSVASQASLTNLALGIGSTALGADVVLAQALAAVGGATGSSTLGGLTLNGVPVAVTGAANQVVPLVGGQLVINEQTASAGGIVVNALHLVINGVADVVIGSATAAIQ